MLENSITLSLLLLSAAAAVTFVRLLLGPTLPDRVVAMDLLGIIIVGLIVVSTAATGERAFLDVAIVIALVSFVGTVAYSRYIERSGEP
jgi:multicomponent Na+:H+ antiporter subunit F